MYNIMDDSQNLMLSERSQTEYIYLFIWLHLILLWHKGSLVVAYKLLVAGSSFLAGDQTPVPWIGSIES